MDDDEEEAERYRRRRRCASNNEIKLAADETRAPNITTNLTIAIPRPPRIDDRPSAVTHSSGLRQARKGKRHKSALKSHSMLWLIGSTSLITFVTAVLSVRPINCDLVSQEHGSNDSDQDSCHDRYDNSHPNPNEPVRRRRHADSVALAATTAGLSPSDTLRVAALASKLEQWFTCHRLGQLAAAASPPSPEPPEQVGGPTSQAPGGCPAHFDQRLCWPATRAGQEARLACPRVHWLPGDQPAKPVINPAQLRPAAGSGPALLLPEPGLEPAPVATGGGGSVGSINEEQRGVAGPGQVRSRFALRQCELATEAQDSPSPAGRWQDSANYDQCAADGTATGEESADKWTKLDQEPDRQLFARLADELYRIEGTIDPYSDPDLLEQWMLCIGNIMRHHKEPNHQAAAENHDNNSQLGLWCPIIFDGWRCWPSTRAGETAYVSCPSNQPGFSAERKAHKICTANGTWYRHPMTNRYWSNYTTCVDTVDLAFRRKILNLYIIGNLISLVALSASLIIFISFKSLNCTRVTIHKNLFLSFITNNLMWIIWYAYVVNDADLLQSNPLECQLWHILLHYFLVSNYFWMFCEGLYLHTLLVVAFVSEDKILKWFYLLGWLTPVPITVAYAYNRSYDEYYTNFCWMEESPYNLILMAPIGISLLLNLFFLVNIVRVLVTKLRANNSPDTHQTRKAVRATCVLIPLLGLHYILTPFRPEAKSEWEGIYESVAAVCTSFQGLCVAMLFCICNGEVIAALKRKLKDTFNLSHHNNMNRANSYLNSSDRNSRADSRHAGSLQWRQTSGPLTAHTGANSPRPNEAGSSPGRTGIGRGACFTFAANANSADMLEGTRKADKRNGSHALTTVISSSNPHNGHTNPHDLTGAAAQANYNSNNGSHTCSGRTVVGACLGAVTGSCIGLRSNGTNSNSSSLVTNVTGSPTIQMTPINRSPPSDDSSKLPLGAPASGNRQTGGRSNGDESNNGLSNGTYRSSMTSSSMEEAL